MKSSIQAVFIDRDGTMGGTGHFIHPKHFTLFPYTLGSVQKLKLHDIMVFAFTNQYRISKGEATTEEFMEQFSSFGFDDAFICPHEATDNCLCRKPKPGLLLKAAEKYNLDLEKCAVIGDVGDTDMLAAYAVNALKILVRTGWGNEALGRYRDNWIETSPDYIADNLQDAVNWLICK
ncbi:HAD-IIIA family hydrolase [Paenibacillus sp. P32E]|uniref:HAD-IIIA family hydrolase n=1 Tax=Paenibacillus sp. P32E TaxID=1349434 RepID=UPI00093AD8DE|nr:HAD-IIIA family hydrolase [Paenibacillus sp. P32E]OKP89118.1 hypothetical protein A3848_16580 [Paenibacillus sp. P32E]